MQEITLTQEVQPLYWNYVNLSDDGRRQFHTAVQNPTKVANGAPIGGGAPAASGAPVNFPAAVVAALLAGQSVNGHVERLTEPWVKVANQLKRAYGQDQATRARMFDSHTNVLPPEVRDQVRAEVAALAGQVFDLDALWVEYSKTANRESDPWKRYTIRDAYQPRPPTEYIAGKLFKLPSLNIVYGAPGTLKSFILADLALSVVTGQAWLPPAPWLQAEAGGITVRRSPVMWLDFDNGKDLTHERFAVLGRAKGLPEDDDLLSYYSMPSPWLDAGKQDDIDRLAMRIADTGSKLVIVDNLGVVAGSADENSADMADVMSMWRRLADNTGAAIVLVHHQRKGNGMTGRAGESLRGHSSIEAALDLALLVEREDQSDIITLKSTKVRGTSIYPFSATFRYDNNPAGEMETAGFYGIAAEDTTSDAAIEREIRTALMGTTLNKTNLSNAVKTALPAIGKNRIDGRIERMAGQGKLTVTAGERTEKRYGLA